MRLIGVVIVSEIAAVVAVAVSATTLIVKLAVFRLANLRFLEISPVVATAPPGVREAYFRKLLS